MAQHDGGDGLAMRMGEVEDAAEGAAAVLHVERFHAPNVTEPTIERQDPQRRTRGPGAFAVAPV
ncbi:hypothetical protein GCM10009853_054180 [Glycomyces scopariae]